MRSNFFGHASFGAQRLQAGLNLIAQGSASTREASNPVKIVFGGMSFVPHSDRLTDVGTGRCQLVLRKFRQRKNMKIVVESASGRMGAYDEDLKLNRRRAEALREELHELGVPRELMTSPVFGADERSDRPGADWARPTPSKVEFTIRAGTSS
jgi:outer membrane protein OmpA-like peptidoglycan-associated protein